MNVSRLLAVTAGLALIQPVMGQRKAPQQEAVVTYGVRNNGNAIRANALTLYIKGPRVYLAPPDGASQREQQYLDMQEQVSYQVLTDDKGLRYTLRKPFASYTQPELLADTATILGYHCKKAKLFIRSNTIEVWYTDQLPIKGTPGISTGAGLGLVLKTIRNGSFEQIAQKIDFRPVKDKELNWPADMGLQVDDAAYTQQVIESRYVTLPIFDNEQICFGAPADTVPQLSMGVTYHFAGGTVILKKVKLPAPQAGQQLFAELVQYSNGDAYDRTGSVFMIPIDKATSFLDGLQKGVQALPVYTDKQGKKYQGVTVTDSYQPTLELMRFFTPFGVRQFNKQVQIKGYQWADSVLYKQDITELHPRIQGEVLLGVFIGNYDKGGHKVSLRLKYYPGYSKEERTREGKIWISPVFNTTNLMEMAGQEYATMFKQDSLRVTVDIPAGLKNLQLRYITTGHGGWGGGDEFNPKQNEIFVDGQRVYHFTPWRTDCATYRLLNPASGNFGNGLSSSDLSRSNWCPGTLTLPVYIPLPDLAPGKHTIQVAIPLGAPEGGSFSAWNISGCLIGEQG